MGVYVVIWQNLNQLLCSSVKVGKCTDLEIGISVDFYRGFWFRCCLLFYGDII